MAKGNPYCNPEKKNIRKPIYDFTKLADQAVRQEYQRKFEAKFEALLKCDDIMQSGEAQSAIEEAFTETAEEMLGKLRRRNKKWISNKAW